MFCVFFLKFVVAPVMKWVTNAVRSRLIYCFVNIYNNVRQRSISCGHNVENLNKKDETRFFESWRRTNKSFHWNESPACEVCSLTHRCLEHPCAFYYLLFPQESKPLRWKTAGNRWVSSSGPSGNRLSKRLSRVTEARQQRWRGTKQRS